MENKGSSRNFSDLAIVFDWDDTILPTTFLQESGDEILSKQELMCLRDNFENILKPYDKFVSEFLTELMQTSDLYIISNAELAWIGITSSILMPQTNIVLEKLEKNNRVISAREFYFEGVEEICREQLNQTVPDWKRFAFMSYLSTYKTVISIGDAEYERNALFAIPNPENNMIRKSIKLLDTPKEVELLHKELHLLKAYWEHILKSKEDLDLYISKNAETFFKLT